MPTAGGVPAAVEAAGREVVLLADPMRVGGGMELGGLRPSRESLVGLLALGPAPELCRCPNCGSNGTRAATRRGQCWEKLVPPPLAAEGGSEEEGAT